jgi:hypothetical protein
MEGGADMYTWIILAVLIFIPGSRKILGGMLSGVFGLLGLTFLVTSAAERRRTRGL